MIGYIKDVERKLANMRDTVELGLLAEELRFYGEALAEHKEATEAFLQQLSKGHDHVTEETLERLEIAKSNAEREAKALAEALWDAID